MQRDTLHAGHIILSTTLFVVTFVIMALGQVFPSIVAIVAASSASTAQAIDISLALLYAALFEIPISVLTLSLVTAALFALNVTAMVHIFRTRMVSYSSSGTWSSVVGVVMSTLGVGCAACGSLLFFSVLGTLGSTALIALPFEGQEVAFIGVAFLVFSTISLIHTLRTTPVCYV